jgi:hypothetical protein
LTGSALACGQKDNPAPPADAAVAQDLAPDQKPTGDLGVPPNSGSICESALDCAPGDECIDLSYFGGKKKMCATVCTPGQACAVANPAKNASLCLLKVPTPTGARYFCLWFCLYTKKSYECPAAGAYDCVQPSSTDPGLKICVPK